MKSKSHLNSKYTFDDDGSVISSNAFVRMGRFEAAAMATTTNDSYTLKVTIEILCIFCREDWPMPVDGAHACAVQCRCPDCIFICLFAHIFTIPCASMTGAAAAICTVAMLLFYFESILLWQYRYSTRSIFVHLKFHIIGIYECVCVFFKGKMAEIAAEIADVGAQANGK